MRVCIRGAAGLLGSRLMTAISRTKDLVVTVGVYKHDATLDRLIERNAFGKALWPKRCFLDESTMKVDEVNKRYAGQISFEHISELNLAEECDVVIDAGVGRDHALQKQYTAFRGPIILQDGEYPRGRLIAPPLLTVNQGGNRYRQGGCLLSGIVPILAALPQPLRQVRLQIVMQHDGRDSDFMITERLNSFRLADHYIPRLEDELHQLFPQTEVTVASIVQIPGLLHYAVIIETDIPGLWQVDHIQQALLCAPRVRLLPNSMTGSYEINLARATTNCIPPILVFGGSIATALHSTYTSVRFGMALYYRTLAVLPNLDSIRMLLQGLSSVAAMDQTDRDMGFKPF